MPFVKLDCRMIHSSIWPDKDCRDVFITSLLIAVPREIVEPIPAINVTNLEYSGFIVPPGWYGFVEAAGTGITHQTGIETARGLAALQRLCSPESESRNPRFEGRRMARIDGGYLILNYFEYRDKDYSSADRQRRYRERKKSVTGNVTRKRNASRKVTQAEAEAEADKELLSTTIPTPPLAVVADQEPETSREQASRMLADLGLIATTSPVDISKIAQQIETVGFDLVNESLRKAISKGVAGKAAIAWAMARIGGELYKRTDAPKHDEFARKQKENEEQLKRVAAAERAEREAAGEIEPELSERDAAEVAEIRGRF